MTTAVVEEIFRTQGFFGAAFARAMEANDQPELQALEVREAKWKSVLRKEYGTVAVDEILNLDCE